MSTEKWINIATIGMSLVLVMVIVAVYAFESGGTESVIPVTGEQGISFTLCCTRVHEKIHSATQPVQSEVDETASPSPP